MTEANLPAKLDNLTPFSTEPKKIQNWYEFEKVLRRVFDEEAKRFNDDFKNNLEQSLVDSGYRILESTKKDGIVTVERNGKHLPEANVYHNDTGRERTRFDFSVKGKVKVISTLYVTVAQKE